MCVRYNLLKAKSTIEAIADYIASQLSTPVEDTPRYNVTLSHTMPVVALKTAHPQVYPMMWGLVPHYERTKAQKRMLPNAKAETARKLSPFKEGVAHRRCLIPANGFYEWKTKGKLKLPHLLTLKDDAPFAFAGFWEPGNEDIPDSYTILTTEPNELIAPIHHRMPVILTRETMKPWLGSSPLTDSDYQELTRPINAVSMQSRAVNRYVNNSRHDGPQCLAPPDEEPRDLVLF
tara:strand:+ start:81 stop:779 length:699 start_codon:yes stop_codon:yes gene_type:complete